MQEDLPENAPTRPQIDTRVVPHRSEQQLRRLVPPGRDLLGHRWSDIPHQAKIGNLQDAFVRQQEISRLQVSVKQAVGVDLCNTS